MPPPLSESPGNAVRRWLFRLHLWCGVGLGLYFAVMGVTGSVLVFRAEIEEAFPSRARLVEPGERHVPLEAMSQAAAAHMPGHRLTWVRDPGRPDRAFEVWTWHSGKTRVVLVDPYSGAVRGDYRLDRTFVGLLQDVHFYLMSGMTGHWLNGFGAILLGAMCAAGLVIWSPARRLWGRRTRELHSAMGFWSAALLAVWAVSGASFAFREPFRRAVGAALPLAERSAPASYELAGGPPLTLDALVRQAEAAAPGGRTSWVQIPGPQPEPLRVFRGGLTVVLDPASGEVLEVAGPGGRLAGDVAIGWLSKLHFGSFGGLPVKAVWSVAGLAPAALFVTGVVMWRRRRW